MSRFFRARTALMVLTLLSSAVACAQQKTEWKDPSKHTAQFVTVQPNIRLEVLDWGGSGRPVVLLAGYGNSAHVFDEFAEKLSETNRVYGITRRGFGSSTRPDSGYEMERLAEDVLAVLDSLKIVSPAGGFQFWISVIGEAASSRTVVDQNAAVPGDVVIRSYIEVRR